MSKDKDVVIVAANRTPMGNLLGELKDVPSPELGAACIKACVEKTGIDLSLIDAVDMGCVLQAGLGQAPARQAAIKANLPTSVACTTINKMCGSGMKAVMQAMDSIQLNHINIAIAGGFESMTRAPYLLPGARGGYRFGHTQALDHMLLDGLEDAYNPGQAMGVFADQTAKKYEFSREAQDEFAIESLKRAQAATIDGTFANEIIPIEIKTRKGVITIAKDENPGRAKFDKIPKLRPAFSKDGTVTAANASSISDGAAALLVMTHAKATELGLTPLAKIVSHTTHAQAPEWFTTAPVAAIKLLQEKCGWQSSDIDLYEINEAFAVVTMAAMHDLKLPHEKVNVHGGACALGHPIGASGARIIVTLLHALQKYDLTRGVASLCIGGGEATAIGIERMA